jgi:hypothetical protein
MRRSTVVAFLALAGALIVAAPAEAAFPGANGRIVYAKLHPSDGHDLFSVDPDGSNPTRLTSNTVSDDWPAWSPDGSKIAFRRLLSHPPFSAVFVMTGDGSGATQLTNVASVQASWAPDGLRIAYTDHTDSFNREIFTIRVDGSEVRNFTQDDSISDDSPAWSPDGSTIAFTRSFGQPALYTKRVDGTSDPVVLASGAGSPDWAPDGSKIAFDSSRDGNGEIYVMNPDGSGQTRLTNNTAHDGDPAWSPDGSKIAFTSERDGSLEIYVMNADGTNQTRITDDSQDDMQPTWQPLPPGSNPPPPYEVPQQAAPRRFWLVPVLRQCGTQGNPANGQHAPPLGTPACVPTQPQGVARFGAQSAGTAWVGVIQGDINPANGDQADFTLSFGLSDIRTGAGADYDPDPSGPDGAFVTRLRFTDRANGPAGSDPGTATDYDFAVPFACTPTEDSAVGSTCALDTSADAITPGLIKENKATVLQVFRLRLNDSGPNGVRGDGDDRIFASGGVYIP